MRVISDEVYKKFYIVQICPSHLYGTKSWDVGQLPAFIKYRR